MTLDELKAEAKAQGYRLMPIIPYVKLAPCKCGRKRIEEWFVCDGTGGIFFQCPVCGMKSPKGKTEREAREKWNEEVQK
jgi:hypothetical protein